MTSLPRRMLLAVLLSMTVPLGAAEPPRAELIVFAASSLTNAMEEIGRAYQARTGVAVKLSFAASSALARQIESGARADAFVSADEEWMDYLETRQLIRKPTRRNLVANRLVLIAPSTSRLELRIAPNFPIASALAGGRLATGDPDAVPVGRYAKAALSTLGVWRDLEPRVVRADNVRTALNFVALGEAPLGIVYATDALIEPRVRIVDVFPANTHSPITYPAALTSVAKPEAGAFLDYLAGPEARQIFRRFGFLVPIP